MGVKTAQSEGVLQATLARPGKKNALDPPTLGQLADALEGAAQNPQVRAVLVAAEGDVFCAGGDVEVMRRHGGDPQAALARLRGGLNRVVHALHDCPKPVVCAVQGNAYGAGAVLAFQCDITIASMTAQFALSFRHLGLVPDTGGTWLLPRRIGMQRAKHLVWTGAPFDAQQAAAWGLVLEAVEPAQVAPRALHMAHALRDGPVQAMGMAKHAMHANMDAQLGPALEREARLQAAALLGREHEEGRQAFFERRKAAWR